MRELYARVAEVLAGGLSTAERDVRVQRAKQAAALLLSLLVSWIGMGPEAGPLRVATLSGVEGILMLTMALDLHRHGRDALRLRWPWLLPVPLVFSRL